MSAAGEAAVPAAEETEMIAMAHQVPGTGNELYLLLGIALAVIVAVIALLAFKNRNRS